MSFFRPNIAKLKSRRKISALGKALKHQEVAIRAAAKEALHELLTSKDGSVDKSVNLKQRLVILALLDDADYARVANLVREEIALDTVAETHMLYSKTRTVYHESHYPSDGTIAPGSWEEKIDDPDIDAIRALLAVVPRSIRSEVIQRIGDDVRRIL